MRWNRRKFLVVGGGVAGATAAGGGWVATSQSRTAGFFRERVAESWRAIAPAPERPRPDTWDPQGVTLAWLGHATVLIQFHGLTILTDPALCSRVGLNLGLGVLGPKRWVAPALDCAALPPIDVLLLSHAHMDHLDLPTLRRLPPAFAVTAAATTDLLAGTPFAAATELRWGESATYRGPRGDLRVEAFEVKHWGARLGRDTHRGYNGYLLEREGTRLIFGGDTALTPSFRKLRPRGPFAAALMPIGAYRPWIRNHCTPEEAWQMANEAGAARVVPIHHRTFKLSDEPLTEPLERLLAVAGSEAERIALRQPGETCRLV